MHSLVRLTRVSKREHLREWERSGKFGIERVRKSKEAADLPLPVERDLGNFSYFTFVLRAGSASDEAKKNVFLASYPSPPFPTARTSELHSNCLPPAEVSLGFFLSSCGYRQGQSPSNSLKDYLCMTHLSSLHQIHKGASWRIFIRRLWALAL